MFRTEFPLSPPTFALSHDHNFLSLGSCFAEVIGGFLNTHKFNSLSNPFGIIYNPVSLFNLMDVDFITQESAFVEREGIWFNFHLHSQIFALSREDLKEDIHQKFNLLQQFLTKTEVIIITLGTSLVYKNKSTNDIVANCHKLDNHLFIKQTLSVDEILEGFAKFHTTISAVNSNIKIILSISPVRHIKDTIPFNHLSKSILTVACHEILAKYANTTYFPSFEIMMDDLRDYRFYKEDMIHPTEQAENYIMKKFTENYMKKETVQIINKIQSILKDLSHKAFYPQSHSYHNFLNKTIQKINELGPELDFSSEIALIEQKLSN